MPKKSKCWLFAILWLSLTNCSAPPGDLPRFHEVDAGKVYRLGQPTRAGYAYMAKSGIRTVLKLNTDELELERAWAAAEGIRLVEDPLPGLTAPTEAGELMAQATMQNSALWPVAVHCEQGEDRTGLAIALYRVHEQGWAPAAALKEWQELGHSPFLFTMNNFFEDHAK